MAMNIKVREMKKCEDAAKDDPLAQRQDAAAERLGHLENIIDSFQHTDREADQSKIALLDYINSGLDTLISGVESKLGLKSTEK